MPHEDGARLMRASGLLLAVLLVAGCSVVATGPPRGATVSPEAAGLPVISVAIAARLLASGKLDGQAVAVTGYYNEMAAMCPAPEGYVGPLEDWCHFTALTDTRDSARLCEPYGSNGTSCSMPSTTYLSPFFMPETSGRVSPSLIGLDPVEVVLIGHAGDPRQWQCTTETQDACASAFVVDRVAWADGHEVPPAAPATGNQETGEAITPAMTLAQIAAAIGLADGELLTGAAFRAGDVATIDPRWNLAGDDLVWVVRSIGPAPGSAADESRPETVWLVDDANGRVIDSQPLELDVTYQPARLWQMATVQGVECCDSDLAAFTRVVSADGAVVYEGPISGGSSGGPDSATFGGGYSSRPLVLPPGEYTVAAWLGTFDQGVAGSTRDACSTQLTLTPLEDARLNAEFPADQACTLQRAPATSPGS
jgi:hypothetical protein